MTPQALKSLIQQGENAAIEFKAMPIRLEVLAREMVAFANGNGGSILLGVADDGTLAGVDENGQLEEWVMNITRTSVIPALSVTCEMLTLEGVCVFVVTVPKGNAKINAIVKTLQNPT